MKLLVVFSTLVCLCAAQGKDGEYVDSSSYQAPAYNQGPSYSQDPYYGSHAPSYLPYRPAYGSYSGSYGHSKDQSVLNSLEVLNSLLDTREAVQDVQFERVAGLRDEANDNVAVVNNFNEYIYAEINNEQYQQNSRLDRLEERLTQIQAIRESVEELDESADAANAQVMKETDYSKAQHAELKDIENDAADRANSIALTQQREDHVTERVDFAEDRIAENARSLDILETNVRRTIDSVNRMRAYAEDVDIEASVGEELTFINFEPPFVGEPQFNAAFAVGAQISNPSTYAKYGYPTLYSGLEEQLNNRLTRLSVTDMSGGNFQLAKVSVTTDNVYFDNTVYSKDFLDGIVTESFEFPL